MRSLITALTGTALATAALQLASPYCLADPTPDKQITSETDFLRFTNGDTLHGSFLGFGKDQTLRWKNPEATDPIIFSTKKSHRIILNRGQGHLAVAQNSSVTLANGDIIPGAIVSADRKSVILKTEHLGQITIPKKSVTQISPTPFGGKILYYGPLSPEGWEKLLPPEPKKENNEDEEDDQNDAPDEHEDIADNKEDKKDAPTNWKHLGTAWYSGTDKYSYLVRENALPDKCRLFFKLAWRGSLYTNVVLHADFTPPKYDGKVDARHNMAATVGHAYVISLSSHNATLYSCTFDENGKPSNTRIEDSHANLNLSGEDEADFELRLDRPNKQILLYLNGAFKIKWHLGDEYHGKGNALAFRNLRYNKAELRISNIIVSKWNGLKDSAQSMRTPDRDVILLTNGVDRFSGTFNGIENDNVTFTGRYNNRLNIPVDEVQELHLASGGANQPQQTDDKSVYFYVPPYGRISGIPGRTENGKTKLLSDFLGEVTLDTRYVNIIDFSHQNNLLDLWDDNF